MKNLNFTFLCFLSILFIMDLINPFGKTLAVEFLFIGIISISLLKNNTNPIILCIFFGFLKECFIPQSKSLSVIEFPIICLIIQYFKFRLFFTDKKTHNLTIKSLIICVSLIIHILLNSLSLGILAPMLYLQIFIQSFLIAIVLNFYFEKLVPSCSTIF